METTKDLDLAIYKLTERIKASKPFSNDKIVLLDELDVLNKLKELSLPPKCEVIDLAVYRRSKRKVS